MKRLERWLWLACATAVLAAPVLANDVVFLNGKVELPDGSAPAHPVTIELSCGNTEPVRQATTGKKGTYFLKVERDEFNHIARTLPAAAQEFNDGTIPKGACVLVGDLKGYSSSNISLANFTIDKDLKLPKIVLTVKK